MICGLLGEVMKDSIIGRTDATPKSRVRRRALFSVPKLLRMSK